MFQALFSKRNHVCTSRSKSDLFEEKKPAFVKKPSNDKYWNAHYFRKLGNQHLKVLYFPRILWFESKSRSDKTAKMLYTVQHKNLAKYTIFQGVRVFKRNRIVSQTLEDASIFQGNCVFEKKHFYNSSKMLYFQERCYTVADQN